MALGGSGSAGAQVPSVRHNWFSGHALPPQHVALMVTSSDPDVGCTRTATVPSGLPAQDCVSGVLRSAMGPSRSGHKLWTPAVFMQSSA